MDIFIAAVVAGRDRGELRADVNAELAGQLVCDVYIGVMIRWAALGQSAFPFKQRLRAVCAMILDGLRRLQQVVSSHVQ